MATVKVLRTVRDDLTSHNDFTYPLWTEETGPVKVSCKDWVPTTYCGNGLHGITKDYFGYPIYDQYGDDSIKWMVIEVDDKPNNFAIIDNKKVKFKEGNIIYQGNDAEKAIRMVFDNEESLGNLFKYDFTYQLYFGDKVKDVVKDNGHNIRYPLRSNLDFIDYELCKIAITQNGNAISYILEYKLELVTDELLELAVNQNGNAISYILEYKLELVDYELLELAVNQNGLAIYYILECKPELVDYDLCQLAVNKNGRASDYILKYKSELFDYDLCQLAVNRSEYAIDYILHYKRELVTDELRELNKKLWQ